MDPTESIGTNNRRTVVPNLRSFSFDETVRIPLTMRNHSGRMKRMKRFVLAHRTEKDPMWKSSDNLLAGIAKMNLEKFESEMRTAETIEHRSKEEEEDAKDSDIT